VPKPWMVSNRRAYSLCRLEAGRLWSDLVARHSRIRQLRMKWPTRARWERWAQGRYPNLHSQSVQQLIAEFLEAIKAVQRLRQLGHTDARYPTRSQRYHQVTYTNQAVRIGYGYLRLPNGSAGPLHIRIPSTVRLPGRLMEVRLLYGVVQLVCKLDVPAQPVPNKPAPVVGIDLGVNTLIAATDGVKALLISGRGAKATVQWRNKRLAYIQARQSSLVKGSGRHRRLQRRKYLMLAKSKRRIRDLLHKATRQIAHEFPGARCVVGEPWNDAAQHCAPRQAQQVSSACNRQIIGMLDYKTAGATQVNEAWTSRTCPWCGHLSRAGRIYRCRGCGISAPRDVIGATNILSIGTYGSGSIQTGVLPPTQIRWVRPQQHTRQITKYPGGTQVVPADTRHVALSPQGVEEAAAL
jgi:putative transposase